MSDKPYQDLYKQNLTQQVDSIGKRVNYLSETYDECYEDMADDLSTIPSPEEVDEKIGIIRDCLKWIKSKLKK